MDRRRFLNRSAIAGAAALLPTGTAAGKPGADPPAENSLTLVADGKPTATIVVAADAGENARLGAAELQHYVERMSGAKLPIKTDAEDVSGTLVLVGKSRFTDKIPRLKIPTGMTPQLREECFVVISGDGALVLAGNDVEPYYGTRYAVSHLLHSLGVRWFMPGAFGELVPTLTTIRIPPMNVRQTPSFLFRDFWEHSRGTMEEERAAWKIRNFMNPRIQKWVGVPSDGSLVDYLPRDQFKDHPDWFAKKREGGRDDHMACMTSPGMIQAVAERVKAEARAGKLVTRFAPDDGAPRCYCDNCMKLASAFDGFGSNDRDPWPESSISQEWFHFVDSVLKEVNKEFPHYKIATNGYSNREFAPDLPNLNPSHNLVIMFANICACTIHHYDDPRCWQMKRQGQMVQAWTAVSDKVWMYDYNYTMLVGKGTPTPMVHRVRQTIPQLKQWGVIGFLDQDECDWSTSLIPTRLVRARLEWDTSTDVDAVLSDFFTRWYGAAAASMQAYHTALDDAFARCDQHAHEDVILSHVYTSSLMNTLDRAIAAAETAAPDEPQKTRVRLDRVIHDHLRNYVQLEQARQSCDYAAALACTRRMIALKAEMNTITPFMGWYPYPVYDAEWERDRMAGQLAKTHGPEGSLVTALPVRARFRTDPFDDGRYEQWQKPEFDASGWQSINTTAGWESQGYSDLRGHPYRGAAWYRLEVEAPESVRGKPVRLFGPAAVNEIWVWVNGRFAGRRPYQSPWSRPQQFDIDVTNSLKPGEKNLITIRVLANYDVFGANGIYERMFLYSPKSQGV